MSSLIASLGAKIARLLQEPGLSVQTGSSARSHWEQEPIAAQLPFEAYEDATGLFINQNSLGFVIEAAPIVGGDESLFQGILSLFEEVMEEGDSIQFLLWADHRTSRFLDVWEKGRSKHGDVLGEICRKRVEFFKGNRKEPARIFRFIISYSVPKDKLQPVRLIQEKKERLMRLMRSITHAFAWDAEQFLETVSALVNFSMSPEAKDRFYSPSDPLYRQIPQGGTLQVEEDRLRFLTEGETAFKSLRVVDFPKSWSIHSMQQLIGDIFRDGFRIRSPFFIHYGVHLPHQAKAESGFYRRSQLVENQGRSHTLLRMIPELVEELGECDTVRRSLKEGSKFVWTQLSAGVWSQENSIKVDTDALRSVFRVHQFHLSENRCVHFPMFLASLPMGWGEWVQDLRELNLLKTTMTDECAHLVPIQGEWMGTSTQGMLMVGRRGQLLNWNPFDNRSGNYNIGVVGRSGSGKSVFMQDLLVSGLSSGAKVFVLEVGRSFEKMCHMVQGQQIHFSKESSICLNPFSRVSIHDEEERLDDLNMIKSVIGCMASPIEGVNDYESALIAQAINAVWEEKKNQANISDVVRFLLVQEDAVAKSVGTRLVPYGTMGAYRRYFDGKNNVDFSSPMVLIELEELKEKKDLQAVVLQLFIVAITQQAFLGDRRTPFFICIDEAWDLLRAKQTGPFIETLARRLRKYRGSLVVGTQSIDDFFATPGSKAAFDNSDWLCLLAQKKSSIRRLSESGKLPMTEGMARALESVTTKHGEYSEVMITDADGNYSIARLILDPFSSLLYSTKAEEYCRIKALQEQGLTITQAIQTMIEDKKDAP